MRQLAIFLILMILLGVGSGLAQDRQHTVQAGDTLFSLAQRYGVTVQALAEANQLSNPNQLSLGQVLLIPAATGAPVPPTSSPTASTRLHVVAAGDSLYSIAARYGVTVASLAQTNNINNFNLILVGQRLQIPLATTPNQGTGGAITPPITTPAPNNRAEAVGFSAGVQVYANPSNAATVSESAINLGVAWVKLEVDWSRYESTRGRIDFSALDTLIQPFDEAGIRILLTVKNAPAWARSTSQDKGPALNDADYASFIRALAGQYRGVVAAYEIWSEPNVRREWNGKPISAQNYMNLLKLAFNAVKSADPAALVISAGLAPTEANDGVNAVNDRNFLRDLYRLGLADFSDGVGVHALGWANPPDSTCCRNNRPSVPAWDDSPAFFFLNTLNDYRQIMLENKDDGTFLWVTSFGWGSAAGVQDLVNPDFGYLNYTDAQEQAQYSVRALQKGRDLSYVGPMFLSNLNACGNEDLLCPWSLTLADGTPRPVYNALQMLLR